VPDPLDEGARARGLSPRTLRLQQQHVHSAASAALAGGIPVNQLTSLAALVQPDTVRTLLRQLWQQDGRKLSAYTHGVAITLIAIAAASVQASPEDIAALKALRKKLGSLPKGMTAKNRALLRQFEDPRLLKALVQLPDPLWRIARRTLATSSRSFVDLQTALAIDILLHTPLRMANLSSLDLSSHLHWPQGRRNPAIMTFEEDETKNDDPLMFELPAFLAERLQVYRSELAPAVIGRRPDKVFVTKRRQTKKPGGDLDSHLQDDREMFGSESYSPPIPSSRSEIRTRYKP
jgi:hypothetical protein